MNDYTLIVNGVEIPVRNIKIEHKPNTEPGMGDEITVFAEDAIMKTEDVGELILALMEADQ